MHRVPVMRIAILLLALAATGCDGIALDGTVVTPPAMATPPRVRWAQYCTYNGSKHLALVNDFLRAQGEQGWQLVSVTGRNTTIYCFARAIE